MSKKDLALMYVIHTEMHPVYAIFVGVFK